MTETQMVEQYTRPADPTAYGPHAGLEDVVLPSNFHQVADRLEGAAERRQRDTAALLRPDGSRFYSDEEHAERQREIDERWAAAQAEAGDFLQHAADGVDAEEEAEGGDALADGVSWEAPWVSSFLQVATREVDALPWSALLARLRRLAYDAQRGGKRHQAERAQLYGHLVALRRGAHIERLGGASVGTGPDAAVLGEIATVLQDLERRYGQGEARKEELHRRKRELVALRRRLTAARHQGNGGLEAIKAQLRAQGGYGL